MNWKLALEQIAYVAGECVAVREAGFTEEALRYPRSEAGLVALCAFNGIKPEQAPRGWKYWPGEQTKKSWERVIEALWERAVVAMKVEASDNGSFVTYGTVPFVPASVDGRRMAETENTGSVPQGTTSAVGSEASGTPTPSSAQPGDA